MREDDKEYILTLLFMKYVSNKYQGQADAMIEIPSGCAFRDIAALQGNSNIGEQINKIITNLAEANELQGVINVAEFNDEDKLGKGKEMVVIGKTYPRICPLTLISSFNLVFEVAHVENEL